MLSGRLLFLMILTMNSVLIVLYNSAWFFSGLIWACFTYCCRYNELPCCCLLLMLS